METKFPVVLVHGLWANDHVWEDWALGLVKLGYEVKYASMEHVLSFNEAVRKVRSVIDTVGVCNLIGHSLGGLVCRRAAALTSLVNKLVAVCPAPAMPLRMPYSSWKRAFRPQYFNPIFRTGDQFIPTEQDMAEMFGSVLPAYMRAINYGSLVRSALIPRRIGCSRATANLVISSSGDPTCGPKVQDHLIGKGFVHFSYNGTDHYPMLDANRHENLRRILNWMEIRSKQRTSHELTT